MYKFGLKLGKLGSKMGKFGPKMGKIGLKCSKLTKNVQIWAKTSDIPVAKKSSFGRSRVSKGRVAGGLGYPTYPPGYLGRVPGYPPGIRLRDFCGISLKKCF